MRKWIARVILAGFALCGFLFLGFLFLWANDLGTLRVTLVAGLAVLAVVWSVLNA